MTTSELFERHAEEWKAATAHPFLDGVADGSLSRTAFRTWLIQDYLFVCDLLQFQAQLLSVAPRSGHRVVAHGLLSLITELEWFERIAERMNLKLDVRRHAITEAYCLRLRAYAQNWPSGITALWTSERAYLESWSQVAPGVASYREFVEHWTQPDFHTYVRDLEKLVDVAGPDEDAFVRICGLERDFWEMAWSSARA